MIFMMLLLINYYLEKYLNTKGNGFVMCALYMYRQELISKKSMGN